MKVSTRTVNKEDWQWKLLRVLNLRPEEGERTLLMFVFYTITSVGLLWLEQATIALFLAPYPQGLGAEWLPLIYIASAVMGSGLGFFYSWVQKILPLQQALGAIAFFLAFPLFFLRLGLSVETGIISLATIFLLRLWLDANEILNDLNTQVVANQLFNIREIKRTYPLISSGLLLGDVIAGFSLPLLLFTIGLNNVIVAAAVMMLGGAAVLFFLTRRYRQAFPNTPVLDLEGLDVDYCTRRPTGSLRKYTIPLFAFFILAEVLYLLIEFQYLKQLEVNLETTAIAGFLGLFSGIVGIFELITQWFISSRAIERLGVFVTAMFLPLSLVILGVITLFLNTNPALFALSSMQLLFFGIVTIKFVDELLRYTLIAGIEPFLFQPLPAEIRGDIQARVQGVAEPVATGLTGAAILGVIALINFLDSNESPIETAQILGIIFTCAIVIFSLVWILSAWLLRSSYVNLLVQGAEEGRLGFTNVDLKAFQRATVEALQENNTDSDKRSCIQLLERIDPVHAGEVLSPLLSQLSPVLQQQSLEVMLKYPNPNYRANVEALIEQQPYLEVLVLALRYAWLSQPDLEVRTLKPYLHERVDAVVRGTAASLILRQGTPSEKAEATHTLETMLTSSREKDRVIGAKALQEVDYAQLAQLYVPELLRDESARVRCTLLEVIAAKGLRDYYPAIIKGLAYKSTREAAQKALTQLGNEALAVLVKLTEDPQKSDFMRLQAFNILADIGTAAALEVMVEQLLNSWGITRRNLLRVLLRMPSEVGIEAVLNRLGRSFIESAIDQELLLLSQIYSTILDISSEKVRGEKADLFRSALEDLEADIRDRVFLLMRLLYPASAIQAAALNLKSDSQANVAMGLEILDNTLDLPRKQEILLVLDQIHLKEKLFALEEMVSYQPLSPGERMRSLLLFRQFLSDWLLACCFHLSRDSHWSIPQEVILMCLRHPTGFVREAVLAYLYNASPKTCLELLPLLQNDPNPLVAAEVERMRLEFGE